MNIPIVSKIWCLLGSRDRSMVLILFVLTFVGMALETLGVGMIIPALALITQNDIYTEYPMLQKYLVVIGSPKQELLIIYCMLVIALVYFIKVVYLAFFTWCQAKYVFDLQVNLSQKLYKGYLHQPYSFHLQHNSAQLIHSINSEVANFIKAMESTLTLFSEGMVLIGITILIFMVHPVGALLITIALGITGWVFHLSTKNKVENWGTERINHDVMRLKHLQQGFGGVKEVKLLGRETEFLRQYEYDSQGSSNINKKWVTLNSIPRFLFELISVLCLVILVIVNIMQGNPLSDLVIVLGLFVAAAFRIMPSISRITSTFQGLQYLSPSVEKLYSEFMAINNILYTKQKSHIPFTQSIQLENIIYSYSGTTVATIRGINLIIPRGSSIGLVGKTGSGKSTLVDIILGLLNPDSGTISVDGCDIKNHLREWQNQIGYVSQSIYLIDDSIRRNVAFGLPEGDIDDVAVRIALKSAKLIDFVDELKDGVETVVGERGVRLSGGQRQRIAIARALYNNPEVLVLDESTSSLDISTEKAIIETVRNLSGNKTIIIVTHNLSTISHCEKIFCMEDGLITEEKPSLLAVN